MLARRLVLILFSLLMATAQAQSDVEKRLNNELRDRVFLIRNFYGGDLLRYDATGTLATPAQLAPWTLGAVEVKRVRVNHNAVEIEGRHVSEVFDPETFRFVHMPLVCRFRGPCRDKMRIHIDFPGGVSESVALAALRRMFIQPDEKLSALVPEFWRAFMERRESGAAPQQVKTPGRPGEADANGVYKVGAGIQAPKLLYDPDPDYSDAARLARINGTVVLGFVVDTEGVPQNIEVVRPVGAGLEESAIETVRTWRFEPARRKDSGEVVPVRLTVEVNFRLY